jgi:hypothetical protein
MKDFLDSEEFRMRMEEYKNGLSSIDIIRCLVRFNFTPRRKNPAEHLMEFLDKAGYLYHPDVPYNGTEKGDSPKAWRLRVFEAAIVRLEELR